MFLHEALAKYIRRLVGATRPYNAETDWHHRSPSELVEKCVDLGALAARHDLLGTPGQGVGAPACTGAPRCIRRTCRSWRKYVLGHRVWLGPHAASHGVTVEMVIDDVVDQVPVP